MLSGQERNVDFLTNQRTFFKATDQSDRWNVMECGPVTI